MKIRITALMLAVVMLLTLLSGCGAADAELEATTVAATEEPTVESTTESATETTKETGPKTVMVPKEATVHVLKERKAKAWEYTWFFEWDEQGYPVKVLEERNEPDRKICYAYVKKGSGFYWATNLKSINDVPDEADLRECALFSSEKFGEGWCNENYERMDGDGSTHTQLVVSFHNGRLRSYVEFQNNPMAERIYNDVPDDPDSNEWLYAEYTYDEYGNPIRIDTYNQEEELCGYVEVEWMEIEIKP